MTLPNISGLVTHFDATKITNKNNNDDNALKENEISGTTIKIKLDGTFIDKPLMIKKDGTFEQVSAIQVGGWI